MLNALYNGLKSDLRFKASEHMKGLVEAHKTTELHLISF